MLTLREKLLENGFDPETGFVIFEWVVTFKRPRSDRSIKRKLSWKSKVLDMSFFRLGRWSYYFEEDRTPRERHREISCFFIARDDKAAYIYSQYDGNKWITKIPINEEDLLESENLPTS